VWNHSMHFFLRHSPIIQITRFLNVGTGAKLNHSSL
jgi:hypothetical protein